MLNFQDEVQSYHWSKSQCSLITIVLFLIEEKLLKHKSFCYLLEDVDHDTGFIYNTQEDITRYIKENLPDVSSVIGILGHILHFTSKNH